MMMTLLATTAQSQRGWERLRREKGKKSNQNQRERRCKKIMNNNKSPLDRKNSKAIKPVELNLELWNITQLVPQSKQNKSKFSTP